MKSLHECVIEYQKILTSGEIKTAYKGIMDYMMNLRNYFANKYTDYYVSGNIYFGYMDMTYFAFTPDSLKNKKLKIAIVFVHDKIKFEVWLAGTNKEIQLKYWKLFKKKGWGNYLIPENIKSIDSIMEYDLSNKPNFNNLEELTNEIEHGALHFIQDISAFLEKNPD